MSQPLRGTNGESSRSSVRPSTGGQIRTSQRLQNRSSSHIRRPTSITGVDSYPFSPALNPRTPQQKALISQPQTILPNTQIIAGAVPHPYLLCDWSWIRSRAVHAKNLTRSHRGRGCRGDTDAIVSQRFPSNITLDPVARFPTGCERGSG